MKSLFIFTLVILSSFGGFAQKQKQTDKRNNPVEMGYTCPMHPEVKSAKAGKCPTCKMDLVASPKEQTYTCPMHANVLSDHAGKCPECKMDLVVSRKGSKQADKAYTCSMHGDVKSDKPGKCPVCSMELRQVKADSVHQH